MTGKYDGVAVCPEHGIVLRAKGEADAPIVDANKMLPEPDSGVPMDFRPKNGDPAACPVHDCGYALDFLRDDGKYADLRNGFPLEYALRHPDWKPPRRKRLLNDD